MNALLSNFYKLFLFRLLSRKSYRNCTETEAFREETGTSKVFYSINVSHYEGFAGIKYTEITYMKLITLPSDNRGFKITAFLV